MVADNLAAHFIGGFQTSFNNHFFCRRCYITQAEKSLPINSIKSSPRTIVHHDSLLQMINANPRKSHLMGVVRPSPMAGLIGFHPITSLPADVMHDYLEGICPLVIMKLLKQASAMRIMTYGKKSFLFAENLLENMSDLSLYVFINMKSNAEIPDFQCFIGCESIESIEYLHFQKRLFISSIE